MTIGAALQIGLPLLPLAGLRLSIPFLGRQQQGEDNIYGGINFGPSGESNTLNFQDLINTMRKNPKIPFLNSGNDSQTFNENFLQGKSNDTSGNTLKTDTFTPQLTEGNINYSLTGNPPETEFLGGEVKKTELLNADGNPIDTSSTTSSTTDISSTTSPNNNKNNDNKDGNNFNKLLYGSLLINPLFEGGKYLFNKAKDMFGKTDDDDDGKGKSDFEDITGITYEKAMELQRKRENELLNRRALEAGFKDAGKYMYLAGAAGMEAGKNIGRNTQDMLRSMAYGQSSLANTIAGAAKTTPLARTYFS